ncbi:hypothetical protein AGMMS50293_29970 [Spirochaetia bacterium]|nr:hypothetical protein AGMMS50293_29970 [Spirochaetia bacterium]
MKKIFLALALVILAFASCGTGTYPSFTYTNNSGKAITFRTAEKDSPRYELAAGGSIPLDSAVRGRADIVDLQPSYVSWEYNNGDVYDIVFIAPLTVEVKNYLDIEIMIIEEKGHLDPAEIIVKAVVPGPPDTPGEVASGTGEVKVYTNNPKFNLWGKNSKGEWENYSGIHTINLEIDNATLTVTITPTSTQ